MSKLVAFIMLVVAASIAILRYLSGDKEAFADDYAAGSVFMLVGVLGGFFLAASVPMLLIDIGFMQKSYWTLGISTMVIFLGWYGLIWAAIHRLRPKDDV